MRRTIRHECGGYSARLVDLLYPGYEAFNVHLQTAENDSGQLDLTLPPTNPEAALIGAMASELVIYEDDVELFRGRVTGNDRDTYGMRKISCKGILDYLHDTILYPATYTGTSRQVINDLCYEHAHTQIESWKVFNLGTINVPGTITLEIKTPMTTWDAVRQLVQEYGGFVSAKRVNGVNIIDWVEELTHVCTQRLAVGINITSVSDQIKTENLCTVMYGIGKDNLNFGSINNNKRYVVDAAAVSAFGWIEGVYSNSSCTSASQLLAFTQRELRKRLDETRNVSIKAADLADLRDDAERLQVGYLVPCRIPGSEADETMRLKELDWYPFEPRRTTMSIGASMRNLTRMIGG